MTKTLNAKVKAVVDKAQSVMSNWVTRVMSCSWYWVFGYSPLSPMYILTTASRSHADK